jgi:hypothetical protein
VADNVDGFYVCCGISLAELCKCPYILRLKLFPDGHVSPRRQFCISFDFVFAAVLIFRVVKMVMVVGVARSIHLTLILLRLLGSTCAMASSSFFTRFFSHDFHLSLSILSVSLSLCVQILIPAYTVGTWHFVLIGQINAVNVACLLACLSS